VALPSGVFAWWESLYYEVQLLAVTPYPAQAGVSPADVEYQVQLLIRPR
jgi:hypothetical protein